MPRAFGAVPPGLGSPPHASCLERIKVSFRLLDLSQPIFDAGPNCPAHPPVRSEVTSDHTRADWHWETLTLASHTGSHLDAPLHKIAGGASIDALPLESFVGPATIADLRPLEPRALITPERLSRALPDPLPPD